MTNGFAKEQFLEDLDDTEKRIDKASFPKDCELGAVQKVVSKLQIRLLRYQATDHSPSGYVNFFGKFKLPVWLVTVIVVFYFHAVQAGLNPLAPIVEAMKAWGGTTVITTAEANE